MSKAKKTAARKVVVAVKKAKKRPAALAHGVMPNSKRGATVQDNKTPRFNDAAVTAAFKRATSV